MNRVIAYVDGFNLYFGLKSKGWRRFYWLDVQKLVESLLLRDQKLLFTKYFTSCVSAKPGDPSKPRRQAVYLEALRTLPGLTVFFGHYLAKEQVCRKCGATWQDYDEKMTDVNIATELLTDAFDDQFDTALLMTADSDLVRPVQIVRARFPAKRIVVAFPPGRSSERLKQVASAYFVIGRGVIAGSQFPEKVRKADGFVLRRPTQWQ